MQSVTLIKKNLYYDSVTLMKLSGQISELPGVIDVLVGMGTDLNKNLLMDIGITTSESEAAGANDLLIGIRAETEESIAAALQNIDQIMNKGAGKSIGERKFETIRQVAALNEGYNLAVVSVPGIYATRECKTALNNDMHVFLFSDNVTVDEEVELKQLANEKNLLLMGPDCGTAIIGGVPLGFANRVRKGNVGIAAASGTGLQHVTTLIDRLGAGISQAIGTGGRDLSERVQGRTMFAALDALDNDADTRVVVILSKPHAPSVADKVLARAKSMSKPVVLCLFGQGPLDNPGNIRQCYNIEETAVKAASLALCRDVRFEDVFFSDRRVEEFRKIRRQEQRYVRGIFCGGTLCDEAMITFRRHGIPFYSNIPIFPDEQLADIHISTGNTFIDMGDDYFTRGKPHPMIEPSLRNKRIIQDAQEPDTAVMLIDIVIGHGSHEDPAGVALQAAKESGRTDVLWIASIVGTDADPQNLSGQAKKLTDEGFVVTESNVRAATLAASLVSSFAESEVKS